MLSQRIIKGYSHMNCLYFDCFAGISGDMTLAALVDLGVPRTLLVRELAKLRLSGYSLRFLRLSRMGVSGLQAVVTCKKQPGHQHRSLRDIERIITRSALTGAVKQRSLDIFRLLARAEAQVHNTKAAEVHFHEVGALDSIIDIVGCAIGIDYLGIEACAASPLPLGHGFVECDHGTLPIPAPATLVLLRGVPVYQSEVEAELVTPTGAAILSSLVSRFGPLPSMRIKKTGYGAGTRQLESIPNLLRLILGETEAGISRDHVVIIEANIDDMSPEITGYLMERLFADGALDVALLPVYMKKNRPGTLVQVICHADRQQLLVQTLFRESTTAGVRFYHAERAVLARDAQTVKTRFGAIKVKILFGAQGPRAVPEFEACRRIARKTGKPLRDVYEEVLRAVQHATPAP
jgi:hypothetical protein